MVSTTSRLRHASFVYQFLDPQDHGIPDIIEAFFCPFTGIFSVAIDIPQFQDWVICRRKFFQSQAETEIEQAFPITQPEGRLQDSELTVN